MVSSRNPSLPLLLFLFLASSPLPSESSCSRSCDLALGSYYLMNSESSPGLNLTYISSLFGETYQQVLPYNPDITNKDVIISGTRVNIPFRCDCLQDGAFLGRTFSYKTLSGDNYTSIATVTYANLTTVRLLAAANNFTANQVLPADVSIKATVNCFCGDAAVSRDYGLFVTYPLRPGENLSSVAAALSFPPSDEQLLRRYNPGVNFSAGEGIVFIPTKDTSGSYRPLVKSTGISGGAIAGISAAALVVILALAIYIYFGVYKRKKGKPLLLPSTYEDKSMQNGQVLLPQATQHAADFSVDKSVEFTYEELAKATNDFSLTNKIGEGGFGAVYYAELRGEKSAIKKMAMQATKEFLAELKVLTHVHHLNLVRLIGYCIENSLFLIYEYIENGNLSQHLRGGSGKDPLPWPTRVQIALASARGLEYIHEHTVPVYIHRDIKSANILIDRNFRGKVADFGLTKLTEVGNTNTPTHLVGTFGYMPPEYAQYGDVSPKVDVYAFGVVLYELISAKEAVVKTGSVTESTGLVSLFEGALSQPDPMEHLKKLVDPRLGNNYPIDSVYKMVQLAKACTNEDPSLRPSMRSVVVNLMTLLSSTEDWDVGNFHGNEAFIKLMSGR